MQTNTQKTRLLVMVIAFAGRPHRPAAQAGDAATAGPSTAASW